MTSKNSDNSQMHPVILVIGQAGVGKSSFINTALGKTAASVGDSYDDGTKNTQAFLCESGEPQVYLIDTPGLDDTYYDDKTTMERILNWLEDNVCKNDKTQFGGILYLIEAGQNKLPMHHQFQKSALLKDRLVVVGTKSSTSAKYKTAVQCRVGAGAGDSDNAEAWKAIKVALEKGQNGEDLEGVIRDLRRELGSLKSRDKTGINWRERFSFLLRIF